MKVEW